MFYLLYYRCLRFVRLFVLRCCGAIWTRSAQQQVQQQQQQDPPPPALDVTRIRCPNAAFFSLFWRAYRNRLLETLKTGAVFVASPRVCFFIILGGFPCNDVLVDECECESESSRCRFVTMWLVLVVL